jgi:hypothetical protein
VLEGAARLRPVVNPGDWAWHWRENHGTPAYHPGLVPFVIESEAAFLRRHGLLDPEEAARVPTDDWKPELIDEGDAAA